MSIVHEDIEFYKTDPDTHQDTTTAELLLRRLHRAPLLPQAFSMLWTPNGGPTGDKKHSVWSSSDDVLPLPKAGSRKNFYFGVNPSAVRRQEWEASTNETIGAVNAFLAEFDGKDFVHDTEWKPLYVTPDLVKVAEDARAELKPLGLTEDRMAQRVAGRQRGALQRAQTAAIDAAYKMAPAVYKRRALAHIKGLPKLPTALWDSGGGYQAVWIFDVTIYLYNLDESRNLEAFEQMKALQRKWTAYVGGDPSASDLRRILRLPDSINFKPKYAPNFPTVEFLWCDLENEYNFDELVALLPADAPKRERRRMYVPVGAPVELGEMGELPALPRHFAIDELNRTTCLRTLLLDYGYTLATGNRLSRPGGDTAGVELHTDNTATIYSSADPLYCERRIRPADAIVMYDHGGNVDSFLSTMPDVRTFQEAIRDLRRFTETVSFAPFIPKELVCERAYLTDSTDTRIAAALVDQAVAKGSLTFCVGLATLRRLSGVGSRSTVTNALKRLNGWFVTVTPGDAATKATYSINLAVVRTLDTSRDDVVRGLDSTYKSTANLSNPHTTYSRRKADDPWQSGCTRRLRRAAKAATEGVQSTDDAKQTPSAIWLDDHFPKGLGETILRLVATLERIGEGTRKELAAETGKAPGSVAVATRKAEELGLLEAEREHSRAPAIYSLADNYMAIVDDLAPTLRTYGLTHERGEKDAADEQRYIERTLKAAEDGHLALSPERIKGLVTQLMRAKNRRFKHLKWLHPEWTSAEINRWIDAQTVHAQPFTTVQRLERIKRAYLAGERVEQKPRRRGYTPKREGVSIFAADAEWESLNAWATMQHGPGWWVRSDPNGILGTYERYLAAQERMPTMHFDGGAA